MCLKYTVPENVRSSGVNAPSSRLGASGIPPPLLFLELDNGSGDWRSASSAASLEVCMMCESLVFGLGKLLLEKVARDVNTVTLITFITFIWLFD